MVAAHLGKKIEGAPSDSDEGEEEGQRRERGRRGGGERGGSGVGGGQGESGQLQRWGEGVEVLGFGGEGSLMERRRWRWGLRRVVSGAR